MQELCSILNSAYYFNNYAGIFETGIQMNQQSMCILLPMIHWSAFLGAYFLGLSDMVKCSGGLQMAAV